MDSTSIQELPEQLNRLMAMLQRDPRNVSLRRQCVDIASRLGHFDIVKSVSEIALRADATDATAQFDLATGLIGLRQYDKALELLRAVRARVGEHEGISLNSALCAFQLGDYRSTCSDLEPWYKAGANNAGAVRLLASARHHLGEMDAARKIAGNHEEMAGNDAGLAGTFALIYLDTSEPARASRWASRALELDPKSVDGRVVQATLLTLNGDLVRARELFEGLVAEGPQLGRAWLGLATLSLLERDFARARSQVHHALKSLSKHVGSWQLLGWIDLLSGDLAAAQSAFEAALGINRNFSESHGGLAVVAAMRGERVKAQESIRLAKKLDANCLSARFAEAVLAGNADPERAKSIIREAVQAASSGSAGALGQMLTRMSMH